MRCSRGGGGIREIRERYMKCLSGGGVREVHLVCAGVFALSDREGGGGRESRGCPSSLETSDGTGGGSDVCSWQENPPTCFERGRWWLGMNALRH